MLRCQADRCDRDSSSHLHRVSYREKFKMTLCGKHNYQMERGGVIKEQSRYDKNKIEVVDNYAKVYCNNKYGEIIDFFIIDIEDIDKVSRYKWFIRSDGRVVSNTAKDKFEKSHIRVHNYIIGIEDYSLYKLVDHIDRNPKNNRKSNLRVVDAETNIINRGIQKNNKTGVTGVVSKGDKYIAQIKYKRKMYRFGVHEDFCEAVKARANAEAIYFKDRSVNYDKTTNRIKICVDGEAIYSENIV